MVVVEVCVESVSGVRVARAAGAQRVELCAALGEGGLTPGHGLLAAAVAAAGGARGIELVALARPRGGDFLYTDEEYDVLAREVVAARVLGADGVALGCLTAEGAIDEPRCARLVALARPLRVTFHRAFDMVRDPELALETLVGLGIERVLTSGQAARAREGQELIARLVRAARGRIEVVAAGGVRPGDVRALVAETGVAALHFAASERRASAMRHRNPEPRLAAPRAGEEYAHWETDAERVRAVLAELRG